jgi:hypothetical protein
MGKPITAKSSEKITSGIGYQGSKNADRRVRKLAGRFLAHHPRM